MTAYAFPSLSDIAPNFNPIMAPPIVPIPGTNKVPKTPPIISPMIFHIFFSPFITDLQTIVCSRSVLIALFLCCYGKNLRANLKTDPGRQRLEPRGTGIQNQPTSDIYQPVGKGSKEPVTQNRHNGCHGAWYDFAGVHSTDV